jgi:hypothetical protein
LSVAVAVAAMLHMQMQMQKQKQLKVAMQMLRDFRFQRGQRRGHWTLAIVRPLVS